VERPTRSWRGHEARRGRERPLAAAIADRRLIVCCGSGGVGKTTVSAALALGLAMRGERVVVVTIDPARRLASALAMDDLHDEARRVPDERAERAGLVIRGELWALQLDAKATFDRLVARHAPSPEARERILGNRIYRHLASAVAGSQEYMAVERLHELVEEGRFDRIVLDTPPARNALEFLDAPERMIRFIEGRALRLLMVPAGRAGGFGRRALQAGGTMVLSVLERLTGAELLRDVSDFLLAFDGMYAGFRDRAAAVRALLRSGEASFVVVSGPQLEPTREAVALWRRLRHDGFPLGGIVVNRVHDLPREGAVSAEAVAPALEAAGAGAPADLAARVAATLEEARLVAMRNLDAVEGLRRALGGPPITQVPAFVHHPVDLEGLARVQAELLH
jgi:anion-transporting  ArsA/GET3 family ATPase